MTLKRRSKRTVLSLLLSLSLVVSLGVGLSSAPREKANAADTETGFQNLSAEEITEAMGAGWNYGNQMEANDNGTPAEDAWMHIPMSQKMMRTVKVAGFKSVRIPVSWLKLIGDAPDYTLDSTYLARLQQVVDWAVDLGLYVIIDAVHGDGYSSVTGGWILPDAEDQDTIKDKYAKVWAQIAGAFKDYDQHVIFESLNEVGADAAEEEISDAEKQRQRIAGVTERINEYNQIFVDTIRQTGGNNDKRWVLIPGCNTSAEYTVGYSYDDRGNENGGNIDYGFKIPEDTYLSKDVPEGQHRIMVSVHYYAPWVFCGDEHFTVSQWGAEANPKKSVGYQGEAYMEALFAKMQEKFTSQGYPVVIGEYGSIDKTQQPENPINSEKVDPDNNEFRKYFAFTLCSNAKANGIIPVYWDNGWNGGFGYGLFDRETAKITQQGIIDGINQAFGSKKKGTAEGIQLDKHKINMDLADNSDSLTAAIAPETATDGITWASSDPKVASVSYKGTVRPKGVGTCIITATADSGVSDYCLVQVKAPTDLKLGLYFNDTSIWSVMEGEKLATVERGTDGGEYTMTMVQDKALMSKIGSLYMKDVTIYKEIAESSIVESLALEVQEVRLNGKKVQLRPDYTKMGWAAEGSDSKGVDLAFCNHWWSTADIFASEITDSDAEIYVINNGTNGNQQYDFKLADGSSAYVEGNNTLEMKIKVSNVVFKDQEVQEDVPATELKLSNESLTLAKDWKYQLFAIPTPADTTEKVQWFSEKANVAAVDKDGNITALARGNTVIHALTMSGLDVTCPVEVKTSAEGLSTPVPNATPIPQVTPDPGAQNTSAPGGQNTSAPGTQNTSAPGGQNTPAPGTQNTPAPGGQQTAAPGGSNGNGSGNGGGNVTKPTPKPQKVTVKKVSLKKVKSSKKKTITVQWKKLSGVSGYKIQVCTSKKFKKGVKKYTVKSAKTTKKTIKKLKSKKKYYVRVCAYKKANGKTYTGKWSSAKKVKVK